MHSYELRRTPVPPVLVERDGRFFIRVIDGDLTIEAEAGQWFLEQLCGRVLFPRMAEAVKSVEIDTRHLGDMGGDLPNHIKTITA
jgi:hypothetical protein